MFGIKNEILDAVEQAPRKFISGLFSVISAPPAWIINTWDSLTEEDKKLFAQAAMSAARLGAKALIASDKGGKIEF